MQFDRCEMPRGDEYEQGQLPKRKSIAGQHRLPEQTDHLDFTLGPEGPRFAQEGDPPGNQNCARPTPPRCNYVIPGTIGATCEWPLQLDIQWPNGHTGDR